MKLNKTKATLYVGKKLTLKVKNTKKKVDEDFEFVSVNDIIIY